MPKRTWVAAMLTGKLAFLPANGAHAGVVPPTEAFLPYGTKSGWDE